MLGTFWSDPERTLPAGLAAATATYHPVGRPLGIVVDNSAGPIVQFRLTIQYWDNDAGAVKDATKVYRVRSGSYVRTSDLLPFISSGALPTAVGDTALYLYAITAGVEYSWHYVD